ncbi:STAT transcription factor coiled coil domain-containing protein [Dioscorea alata]|uniref:STAT transcription factor coiled coil domain-containing protein n=2 Tax=Dioscorea alata TaxID=55571 RepID=A0ACB7TSL3_DIOAL|nr:STAT transcription factor coiled coil domain-containing protein [Dioscorea alata]KAH7652011.1 STAT transcription factor coiled coil domain-containing protein [Dioscorea alata]
MVCNRSEGFGMPKKRKSDASRLDESDRTMYSTFRSAANSLSFLYTQAMHHQKLSFQAGHRHALEKLYQWILRQHEEGSRVSVADIVAHLQNEIEYGGEDITSPRSSPQHQLFQTVPHYTNASAQMASGFLGQQQAGPAPRTNTVSDQAKNLLFSSTPYSPIHRNLQTYHHAQGGEYYPNEIAPSSNGTRNPEPNFSDQNRETNDTSMDMHSD